MPYLVPKPKRLRPRFTLRRVLILFTMLCILLAIFIGPAIEQREAVKVIQAAGGAVTFDVQPTYKKMSWPNRMVRFGASWLKKRIGLNEFFDIFTDVMSVDCSSIPLSDISAFSKFPRVEQIKLRDTGIDNLSSLSGLSQLRNLDCGKTNVRDLSPLRSLLSLEFLHVSDTPTSDLTPLAGLTRLEQLYLHRTQVTDITPITNLNNLEYLGLRGTPVRNIAPLAKLTKLGWLDLRETSVAAADVQALQRALPDCVIEFGETR